MSWSSSTNSSFGTALTRSTPSIRAVSTTSICVPLLLDPPKCSISICFLRTTAAAPSFNFNTHDSPASLAPDLLNCPLHALLKANTRLGRRWLDLPWPVFNPHELELLHQLHTRTKRNIRSGAKANCFGSN